MSQCGGGGSVNNGSGGYDRESIMSQADLLPRLISAVEDTSNRDNGDDEEAEVVDSDDEGALVSQTFLTGSCYEGHVRPTGEKQGRGRFTWPDGGCYEGQYINDKRNGHGVQVSPISTINPISTLWSISTIRYRL